MTYIDRIACAIWVHCSDPGDPLNMPGNDAPLYRIYAVLALAKGQQTTLDDVHDAWSAWCVSDRPYHLAIIPFNELTNDQKEQDRRYMDAIHAVSRQIDRMPSVFR